MMRDHFSCLAAAVFVAAMAPAAHASGPAGITLQRTFDTLSTQADRSWNRAAFEARVLDGQAPTGQDPDSNRQVNAQYDFDAAVTSVHAIYLEAAGDGGTQVSFLAFDPSATYRTGCLDFRKASADLTARGWRFTTFENAYGSIKSDFQRDGMDLKIGNLRMAPFPEPWNPPGSNPQEEQAERDRANLTPGDKAYGDPCVDSVNLSFIRG